MAVKVAATSSLQGLDPEFCIFCSNGTLCLADQRLEAASAPEGGIGRQVGSRQGSWMFVERDIQAGRMLLDQILFGGIEIVLKHVERFGLRA